MKQISNYERGGAAPILLLIGGIAILWLIWELITSSLGSGIAEQRRHDQEMMQQGVRQKETPRPVNHGGVRNRNVTF